MMEMPTVRRDIISEELRPGQEWLIPPHKQPPDPFLAESLNQVHAGFAWFELLDFRRDARRVPPHPLRATMDECLGLRTQAARRQQQILVGVRPSLFRPLDGLPRVCGVKLLHLLALEHPNLPLIRVRANISPVLISPREESLSTNNAPRHKHAAAVAPDYGVEVK